MPQYGGLSRRIYAAFLVVSAIPTAIAGVIGIFYSLETLKAETLQNLRQEVSTRAEGMIRFFDQLSAELLYLADSEDLAQIRQARTAGNLAGVGSATRRLERNYINLAKAYPHVYQIRYLDEDGQEVVRVDRREGQVYVVPRHELQNKSERYYFQEAARLAPGEIYVSPLDLNVEFGQVEKPVRPVIRVATPVDGERRRGMVIINLHADIVLEQVQRMAEGRAGVAYLLDRSGHYLTRTAERATGEFTMEPVMQLTRRFGAPAVDRLLGARAGTQSVAGWIIAHAGVELNYPSRGGQRSQWVMALAFPERQLFLSVVNLYVLYAVLAGALLAVAMGGYALSRRLLQPLEQLSGEAEAVAAGDFSRRVNIRGSDEIAGLGARFNTMAERVQELVQSLAGHRDRLEDEVRARTRDLERERAFLAAVIQHTADGILAVDAEGRVSLSNAAARHLLGLPDEAVGCVLATFMPQWPELVRDVAGVKELRRDVTLRERILALSVSPVGADGSHIVVARDVSEERHLSDERRELDRQMFQMEKMTTLGELAMGLAHEIGNPLAGMKAVVQALRFEEDLPAGVTEALHRFEGEVDRLAAFLHTFHGFAGGQASQPVPCALGPAVEDVLFWVRKEARNQGVEIQVSGLDDVPPLLADPQQLKQLVLNLTLNAVHAMPQGGRLTLSAERKEDRVVFSVADSGQGIPKAVLPHIFEPFFTTRASGTGLGLAIVRKIASQHEARLEVESEMGHGSCFRIHWPIAET
jgi:signal transduction histidine kinase